MPRLRLLPLFALVLVPLVAAPLAAQPESADVFSKLEYRFIGPEGNRVSAVVGVPGDPNIYYVGAASGGVWKSTDGGVHWKPIFDDQPARRSAPSPSRPRTRNVVWAGTGESFIRSNVSLGNGVYRSTDAGKTWTHMGLERDGPHRARRRRPARSRRRLRGGPGTQLRAAAGARRLPHHGRRGELGAGCSSSTRTPAPPIWRWTRPTRASSSPGCGSIDIKTWGRTSGGPGSGFYVSRDGGDTWTAARGPRPARAAGRQDRGGGGSQRPAARLRPHRDRDGVPQGSGGSLWRSDDGGEKWKRVNASRLLNGPHSLLHAHAGRCPTTTNEVYFPSTAMGADPRRRRDHQGASGAERAGGDNHDMWIDPTDASRRMMIGNDGGVSISTNRGQELGSRRAPGRADLPRGHRQRVPYLVYGNRQDDGSMRGPSNSSSRLDSAAAGPVPFPAAPGIPSEVARAGSRLPTPSTATSSGPAGLGATPASSTASTDDGPRARSVEVWPDNTIGWPAKDLQYRFNWTFLIAISPHDRTHDLRRAASTSIGRRMAARAGRRSAPI